MICMLLSAMADSDVFLPFDLYMLIASQLNDNGYSQAAKMVSSATLAPIDPGVPRDRLLTLVQKGLAAEKEETRRGGNTMISEKLSLAGVPPTNCISVNNITTPDFGGTVALRKEPSRLFPTYESKNMTEHKNVVRCARFSPDGRLVATGSADTSIKLLEVEKMRLFMGADGRKDPELRPVIRQFYDHLQPVNDIDFHPQSAVLISGAKDRTIKFFDFSKTSARRAFRVIQDTHNVRSVAFHPCGDYLIAGTDHSLAHLYDVNTFQCYLSSSVQDAHLGGAINQVRYSPTGSMYATCSKDSGVRLWDGVSSHCIRVINGAHGTAEATSAAFTRDQRYLLTFGKDSVVRLWEVASGRQVKNYTGAQHSTTRCQATFSHKEDFVLCVDEVSNEVVVWDSLTAEVVTRIPSGHTNAPKWFEHSPTSGEFVTCGTDRSVRFWKEVNQG